MKETIKKAFLWWIVFLWTVILWFYWFAAYTNLPTQNTWDTITQSIWNDVINKINNIWNNVDTLSWSQLWIWQTRQDVTSSRISWTTYTNNTWKPITITFFWSDNRWQPLLLAFRINWTQVYPNLQAAPSYPIQFSIIVWNWMTYNMTWTAWANKVAIWELR